MGHAGAIISGNQGTAATKISALKSAKVNIANTPAEMGLAVQQILQQCQNL
jgi:succinyl-CoA synthetase alpha subunit